MADPNAKLTYSGEDGKPGFIAAWESNMKNVGVGEQEVIKVEEGIGYEVEIRFKKPFEGTSYASTKTEAIGDNQTLVTTTFNSTTPFPMNIMSALMKNMLKKDMDETGRNLKKVLEQ